MWGQPPSAVRRAQLDPARSSWELQRLRWLHAKRARCFDPSLRQDLPRGATRLKDGHVWVYRSDIVSADSALPGSLVRVTDHRGKPLGTALYSSSSQIAIRMISTSPSRIFPPCCASASPMPSPIASFWSTTPKPTAWSSAKPTSSPA